MPQINERFTVAQPVPEVWAFFQDVPQVADCMPGVEVTEVVGEGTFSGRMKVKLGPISADFHGEAKIAEIDEQNRVGVISARGADRQGGSRASANVRYSLAEDVDGTRVEMIADITLQGSMAQFGRTGLMKEVSSQLTKEFATCLEHKLAALSPEEAVKVQAGEVRGLSLFLRSFWSWIKRGFKGREDHS